MMRESRPKAAPGVAAASDLTSTGTTEGGYVVRWSRCPVHEWLYVSVIDGAWCVGDGDELRGHWLSQDVAA